MVVLPARGVRVSSPLAVTVVRAFVVVSLVSAVVLSLFVIDLRLQTSNLLTWIQANPASGFFVFVGFYAIATGDLQQCHTCNNPRARCICYSWETSSRTSLTFLLLCCSSAPARARALAWCRSSFRLAAGPACGVVGRYNWRDDSLPARKVHRYAIAQLVTMLVAAACDV